MRCCGLICHIIGASGNTSHTTGLSNSNARGIKGLETQVNQAPPLFCFIHTSLKNGVPPSSGACPAPFACDGMSGRGKGGGEGGWGAQRLTPFPDNAATVWSSAPTCHILSSINRCSAASTRVGPRSGPCRRAATARPASSAGAGAPARPRARSSPRSAPRRACSRSARSKARSGSSSLTDGCSRSQSLTSPATGCEWLSRMTHLSPPRPPLPVPPIRET